MQKTFRKILLLAMLSLPFVIDAKDVVEDIKQNISKKIVSEQEIEDKGDLAFKKANGFYQKNQFESAIKHYLEAISFYKQCGSDESSYFDEKKAKCREQIYRCYYYWSMDMALQAEKMSGEDKISEAITLCRKAIEIYPPCREKMEKRISVYQKKFEALKKHNAVSEDALLPDKQQKDYDMDILIRQAEILLKEKKYITAKEKLQKVLLMDPYNIRAIEKLRVCNLYLFEAGTKRTSTTRLERITETEWKWVTPHLGKNDIEEGSTKTIQKKSATDAIYKKLKSIKFEHLSYEDFSIITVVDDLKKRSREQDPEGIGVNIFLRLKTPENVSAKTTDSGDTSQEISQDVPFVEIDLENKTLLEAIDLICKQVNLKHKVERYAVVIASQDIPLDDLVTRIYPVAPDVLTTLGGNSEDPEGLKQLLSEGGIKFPTGAKVVYDKHISRLIATNTPDNLRLIEKWIHENSKVQPLVQIQAKFIEIQQNDLKELGFNYKVTRPLGGASTDANGQLQFTRAGNTGTSITRNLNDGRPDQAFIYQYTTDGYTFDFTVNALNQIDTSDVLATPRVTTLQGKRAVITMIREVYFPSDWGEAQEISGTSGNDSTVTVYVSGLPEFDEPTKLGVELTVQPEVELERRIINLHMTPRIQMQSGWSDYSYTVTENGNARTEVNKRVELSVRQIDTEVSLYDGETIVLGGVLTDKITIIEDKIPIVGEIPFFGRFFQSRGTSSTKENLLIFLTCNLVNPDGSPYFDDKLPPRGMPNFVRSK